MYRTLAGLLHLAIRAYIWILVINAILSWIAFASFNVTIRRIYATTTRITAPVLNPIRRLMYPVTRKLGVDISPLIAIVLLMIVDRIII
jgi:uncharacterized protein YggT (Ycf19 family)